MICRDCGCSEGELHHPGCDMERCPFCGGQLISCDCAYEKLGIDINPDTWAYKHGLTQEQEIMWSAMLEAKGLIPYVAIPVRCKLCGEEVTEFFFDKNWPKYVIPELQKEVLCLDCYEDQKVMFPKGWRKVGECSAIPSRK